MYSVTSNASVGRGLESSLDAVLQSTQENLDRVQQHKGSQAAAMRVSMQRLSAPRSEAANARPASAPKARPMDAKEDVVMKKLRLLEDKAKKSEAFTNSQHQVVQDLLAQNEKLQENQRADRKIILALKEQVSSMKTRLELLLNQEDLREKLSQGHSPTMDMQRLEEMIAQRISQEVAKAMNLTNRGESSDAMRSILQNEALLDKQMQSHANEATKVNKHFIDQMATLEKETLRLKAENDRIKYKQSHLDKIYSELKETVSARELKQEESYKRLFAQYRSELETLTRHTTERVHEVLQLFTRQEVDVKDVKEGMESHISNTGELLAGFDMRMQSHEEGLTSLQNSLALHKQRDFELEERIKEVEAMMSNFIAECEQIAGLKEALHNQSQSIHRTEQHQQVVDLSIKQIHKSIDQTRQMITATQLALETLQSTIQGQVESLTKDLAEYQGQYVDSVNILRTSQQKLKSRLKDTEGMMLTMQDTKAAMQSLMENLHSKIHEEASHIYETQTSLQRIEARINTLEGSLPVTMQDSLQEVREEVRNRIEEITSSQDDKREAWTGLLLDEINSRLKQFDSSQEAFRTNIDQHVEQLTVQLQAMESCLSLQSTTAQHVEKDVQGLKVGLEDAGQQLSQVLRLTEKKSTELSIVSHRLHSVEDAWTQWRDHWIDKAGKQEQTVQTLLQRVPIWQTWETEKEELRLALENLQQQWKDWMTSRLSQQVHEAVDTTDLSPLQSSSPAASPSPSPSPASSPSPARPLSPPMTMRGPSPGRSGEKPRELTSSRDSLADFHAMIEQANHDILALEIASASRSQPPTHSTASQSTTETILSHPPLSSSRWQSAQERAVPRSSRSPLSTLSTAATTTAERAAAGGGSSPPSPSLAPFAIQSTFSRNRTSPLARPGVWEDSPHLPSKRPPDLRRSSSSRLMTTDTGGDSDDSLTRLDRLAGVSSTFHAPPSLSSSTAVASQRWGERRGHVLPSSRSTAPRSGRATHGGSRYSTLAERELEAEAQRAIRSEDEDVSEEGGGGREREEDEEEGFTKEEEVYIQQLMHAPYTGFEETGDEEGEERAVTLDQILEEDFGG